ncbi:possible alpha/beta hydrolase superfamily protein [Prochlorococcus marinus str. MIT 9303]|uniref:Possible alpha/beta hydrolase superfamily protein n=1 Tax=Prochlorococcus marinus (strain MIT 9303) TaxID=59922 RepID=A2C610_PROM3|nr:possible alpha/beta hydrolase superfamily protein [Prochlorococcus marinus str. MIT 9303]
MAWSRSGTADHANSATLLIHGFGACKEHWRHNQSVLAQISPCYAIDLLGFGGSSQPRARLRGEAPHQGDFCYDFDGWGAQVAAFCREVVQIPVRIVGNSIGGVIALRAAQLLEEACEGVVLINCAQRTLDDKRLDEQPSLMRWTRPWLKSLVQQRWLSSSLFRNAANPMVIKRVLKQAYPSGNNLDRSLVSMLQKPADRPGAAEAFHGFINIFDDYLAPELMADLNMPVDLIWGAADPWEPLQEARRWAALLPCIRSLSVVNGAGHCPHDEAPEEVNPLLLRIIQQAA